MSDESVTRFSVSLSPTLLSQFDEMVREKGYSNRSQAVADIIRSELVGHRLEDANTEAAGTVTLVYDHHTRHVQETLTEIQHDHAALIVSTLHVHLDHHNCLEVLVLRGLVSEVKSLADRLIGAKGVKHGTLMVTTPGKDLPA